jgi:hypothetical membrane protein
LGNNYGVIPTVSAWAGAIGFPVFFTVLSIAGSLRPGYSPISQYGSDLGVGWSGSWIFNLGVSIYGIALIVFAIGFYQAMDPLLTRRRSILITTLLILAGLGGLIAGTFTESLPILHGVGGVIIFGFPPVAQVLAGTKIRAVPGLKWYGEYTMVNGVVAVALDVFSTFYPILKLVPSMVPLVNALSLQFTGILQRTQMIISWGWYTISGLRSLRLERKANVAYSQKSFSRMPSPKKSNQWYLPS